ncbi:hypothetical protein [Salibacter sp.]|uniref:DUF7935 family protein n=1 Tax=Salibacter sp. TaxID=2010995 RepID=UPI00286FBD3A|nr:hypothetical protein [Salibacter sp.]MDR9399112.1 hypothetical protein [Salibacter sp.]MDR9488165.1 hypothetical protein [Salibacter sp.]
MDYLFELFKLLIPSGIVGATVYFVIQQYHENQEKIKALELRKQSKDHVNPTKIQAYERLILFLERISPDKLAMRSQNSKLTAQQHQMAMLTNIRNEFDHNLTQQLYVSSEAWKLVVQGKEEAIRIINISASKCEENASSFDLTQMILSVTAQLEHLPQKVAIEGLKREFRSRF